MAFRARDKGKDIYHTNVLMMVAEKFAIIADSLITENREGVLRSLRESGKEIISLSEDEFNNFAANSIELRGEDKNILVISKAAHDALSDDHKKIIEKYDEILPIDVETISKYGGGSIRCMIAENFFDIRKD